MIDPGTEKPVRVLVDDETGPYIKLSLKALDQVQQILKDHDVSFWVGHHFLSVDRKPATGFIWIHKKTDPVSVQTLLDSAT